MNYVKENHDPKMLAEKFVSHFITNKLDIIYFIIKQ